MEMKTEIQMIILIVIINILSQLNPKNESLPKPTYKASQEFDLMNQAPNSDINTKGNLIDMMNNLSLKQRNCDNNSNFSLFINEQNKQIMNTNINNWDEGNNDFINQFNKQNLMNNWKTNKKWN